jgi:hypothetical protein
MYEESFKWPAKKIKKCREALHIPQKALSLAGNTLLVNSLQSFEECLATCSTLNRFGKLYTLACRSN